MAPADDPRRAGQLRRLEEELGESGVTLDELDPAVRALLVEEIHEAMRPPSHERRVLSAGTILEPSVDPSSWPGATELEIAHRPLADQPLRAARRYVDGLSSWLLRYADGRSEWVVFDRPAGSERDLVVLSEALGATIVQRHPNGEVRVVGTFGVLRRRRFDWHLEPPLGALKRSVAPAEGEVDLAALGALLAFAVHDLGAHGIGAVLILRHDGSPGPSVEERLPTPPPLDLKRATNLAPLRHALAQVDGAAVFDAAGVLRQLGVRLVPSDDAEQRVEAFGGTRHIAARRYSYDDPAATVVAVSEDGPVSVMRGGVILGSQGSD